MGFTCAGGSSSSSSSAMSHDDDDDDDAMLHESGCQQRLPGLLGVCLQNTRHGHM